MAFAARLVCPGALHPACRLAFGLREPFGSAASYGAPSYFLGSAAALVGGAGKVSLASRISVR